MIDNQHQPHPYDKSHIRLSYITHFYCNQTNIDSVTELLRHYEQYDPALLDVIEFVIVDDGSPVEYEIPQLNLNITWLRINEDIQWNQAGARNLGVTYAKSDRIVLSDLDHIFPPETLHYMAYRRHPGRSFLKCTEPMSRASGRPATLIYFTCHAHASCVFLAMTKILPVIMGRKITAS